MKRKWVAVLLAVNLVLSGSTMVFAAETDGSTPEVPAVNASVEGTGDELAGSGKGTDSTDVTAGTDNSSALKAAKTVSEVNGAGDEAGTDKTDTENGSGVEEKADSAALAEGDGSAKAADATTSTGTTSNGITWELTDGVLTVSGSGGFYGVPRESIGDSQRDKVTSVKIEEGITEIGGFKGWKSLSKISFPDSLTRIGDDAFYGCVSLQKVAIPAGVNFIGQSAFYGCTSLTEVSMPESITGISASAFGKCEKLVNITIPKGVTGIAYDAFEDCKSLPEVTIPSKVKKIGSDVFRNCTGLKRVIFEGDAPEIGREPFANVTATASHPSGNTTWTPEIKEAMGSKLVWRSSTPSKDPSEPSKGPSGTTPSKTEDLKIVPEVTDSTYVIGNGEGATIKCTGELKDFVSAYMDGVEVDRSNYTLREGSTILTFTSKYLDTLSVGKHKVALKYTDASIDTELNILDKSAGSASTSDTATNSDAGNATSSGNGTNTSGKAAAPKTGDAAPVLPWMIISVLAAGICMTVVSRKRCFR